jgi:uncharacterized protein YijF (DUF1287 family)
MSERAVKKVFLGLALLLCLLPACRQSADQAIAERDPKRIPGTRVRPLPADAPRALRQVVEAGLEQPKQTLYYDQSYVRIDYPGGDLPPERGACTDVVVRAFRRGGVDLQKEVHEDMTRAFGAYPTRWGMTRPDSNIDHRRVPNLRTYFERQGKSLPVSQDPADYLPGDLVTWDLGGGVDHIGMVTNVWSDAASRYLVVHNIGRGARVENVLFAWRITGHYRYF